MTAAQAPVAAVPAPVLAAQLSLPAAWQRVNAKAGMPGVDGIAVRTFAPMAAATVRTLEHLLASGGYTPLPLRLVQFEKKDGGCRTLLVPAVRDRIPQTAMAAWLGARWNAQFDKASFAYRPGLGVRPALRYLRELYGHGYRWVFDADIRQCFDSIDHTQLLDRVAAFLGSTSPAVSWIRGWVSGSVWDGVSVTRLTKGIPQGSPLSPLLANFFLDEFDCRLRGAGIKFVRYADDFLVLARSPFELGPARRAAEEALECLGLSLHPSKTRMTSFEQTFRFLGAEIQGDRILLPFEKTKTPLAPMYVAPRMPPAMLRAWRAGHLGAGQAFDRDRVRQATATSAVAVSARTSDVLQRLRGKPQSLRGRV